jgi:hypothetical protein
MIPSTYQPASVLRGIARVTDESARRGPGRSVVRPDPPSVHRAGRPRVEVPGCGLVPAVGTEGAR